ncbi:hypothetical protein IT411_03775 [Candidatus Peregrinibacteria bacterium]|nr:hypothetical protein [Candidatus Peregrinibacteria bacterium]
MTQKFGFNDFKSTEERTRYERAPTIPDSIAPGADRLTGQGSTVDAQRVNTGMSLKAVLGMALFSVGLGVAGTYAIYKKSGWFDEKEKAQIVASVPVASVSAQEEPVDLPNSIESNEDFAKVIEAYKIETKPVDFEKLAVKNNLMESLRLVPIIEQTDGSTSSTDQSKNLKYKWASMEPNKISEFEDEEVVRATLIRHLPSAKLLDYRGIKPIATLVDKGNPLITYHYYRCVDKKSAGVGSIVIKDAKRYDRNTMLYGLQMPKCKPKADPNMGQ